MAIALTLGIAHKALGENVLPPPIPPVGTQPEIPPAVDLQTFGPGIPLREFLRITLGDMAHIPYVLSPEASQSALPIAVDLTHAKLKDPMPLVKEVIESFGLEMRVVSGVAFIEKKNETEKRKTPDGIWIYKPKNRTVSSLSSYFSVFPDLKFSFSAGTGRQQAPVADLQASSANSQAGSATQYGYGGSSVAALPATGNGAFLSSDKDQSFLVVKGLPSDIETFKGFVEKLDTPVAEVLVQAYVFEVRTDHSKGSSIQLLSGILASKFGVAIGGAAPDPSVTNVLSVNFANIGVAISALTSDSRIKIISSPVLRAEDGFTASVTIGTDVPTLGAVVTNNGGSTQSITYQSAGVILTVSPHILEDAIRLSVSQEISSFVTTTTGLASSPTKLRRSFTSDLVIKDDQAILLGGLSDSQDTETTSKAWFGITTAKNKDFQKEDIAVLLVAKRL
jgi:hypothetical protein